jgi:hypothetical protein
MRTVVAVGANERALHHQRLADAWTEAERKLSEARRAHEEMPGHGTAVELARRMRERTMAALECELFEGRS